MSITEVKMILEAGGLALFAWVIYKEQVKIRQTLHNQSNVLTGIAIAVGAKEHNHGESK